MHRLFFRRYFVGRDRTTLEVSINDVFEIIKVRYINEHTTIFTNLMLGEWVKMGPHLKV